MAENSGTMNKTNFDLYLEEQLQDPAIAARLKPAGVAWDVALQIREQAGLSQKDLAKLLKTSTGQTAYCPRCRVVTNLYESVTLRFITGPGGDQKIIESRAHHCEACLIFVHGDEG